jgi:hypothetical protein
MPNPSLSIANSPAPSVAQEEGGVAQAVAAAVAQAEVAAGPVAEPAAEAGKVCCVAGCARPHYAKDYCKPCYELQRRYHRTERRRKDRNGQPRHCNVPGCDAMARTRGLCSMHYRRWLRRGDPLIALAPYGRVAPSQTNHQPQ